MQIEHPFERQRITDQPREHFARTLRDLHGERKILAPKPRIITLDGCRAAIPSLECLGGRGLEAEGIIRLERDIAGDLFRAVDLRIAERVAQPIEAELGPVLRLAARA